MFFREDDIARLKAIIVYPAPAAVIMALLLVLMLFTLVTAQGGVWPGPANVMAEDPPQLKASFNWMSSQCNCTSIDFNDTIIGGESPYTYSWAFDDGSGNSTDQKPSHHYSNVGSYNVTLQVTDSAEPAHSDTHWEQVQVTSDADLGIGIVDSPAPVFAGQTLTYSITVSNGGPCDAVAVVITDALPSVLSNPEYSTDDGEKWFSYNGTVDLAPIVNGDTEQVLIRAAVGCPAICPDMIANTATVD
ncbi:MAG: PKD domain-containing protein, partial [Dehalococcoidia bacterium]